VIHGCPLTSLHGYDVTRSSSAEAGFTARARRSAVVICPPRPYVLRLFLLPYRAGAHLVPAGDGLSVQLPRRSASSPALAVVLRPLGPVGAGLLFSWLSPLSLPPMLCFVSISDRARCRAVADIITMRVNCCWVLVNPFTCLIDCLTGVYGWDCGYVIGDFMSAVRCINWRCSFRVVEGDRSVWRRHNCKIACSLLGGTPNAPQLTKLFVMYYYLSVLTYALWS